MQDSSNIKTIEQLRQRYNLDLIDQNKKAIELQKNGLTYVQNELTSFANETTASLENLQDQVDGNITTWFFNGVPTLSNSPAVDWNTDTLKDRHLGDLYYDQETGYAYRFSHSTVYEWIKITDTDVTEALALANAAKDTADGKRRVFVTTPTIPYDVGDLWINNNEIYICQLSKASGSYDPNDFINSLKYTDDTVANEVDGKVTVLSGRVTSVEESADAIIQSVTSVTAIANDTATALNNNYLTAEQITAVTNGLSSDLTLLQSQTSTLRQNADSIVATITKVTNIENNGVSKMSNTMATFDETGLTISKSDEAMKTLIDNTGLYVYRDKDKTDEITLLTVNNTGVVAENVSVNTYFTVGNIRVEEYEDGIGFFYTGV